MQKYMTYLFIKFELESPLAIGSGISKDTDKDVLLNSKGIPFIPATALAGVYSDFFDNTKKNETTELEQYFGYVDIERNNNSMQSNDSGKRPNSMDSLIITYDGVMDQENGFSKGIRNGVGLDQFRTSKDGAKYDFEVVNPGTIFWTAIEYNSEEADLYPINKIATAWKSGRIIVGSKSTRGLGKLKCLDIKVRQFDLNNDEDKEKWINFDIYDFNARESMDIWDVTNSVSLKDNFTEIKLTINQKKCSPVTVRVYSTEVSGEKVAPDYSQLTYIKQNQEKSKDIVVIPGTSWAGTFRHNMLKTLGYKEDDDKVALIFGTEKGNAMKSKVIFSETYFDNAQPKIVSRNSIDRFSGGAVSTALFTEKMYYGGTKGTLSITISDSIGIPVDNSKGENKVDRETVFNAIAVAIADLHEGFITVGGESSIGHGLFDITKIEINDKDLELDEITGEKVYQSVMKYFASKEDDNKDENR